MSSLTVDTPWLVVGRGRVGRTLELAAGRLGITAEGVGRETPIPEPAEVAGHAVFLTVPDDAIFDVALCWRDALQRAEAVVICSGSLSSGLLVEAGISAPVGSVHPLLSIAEPTDAIDRLAEAAWTVEGAPQVCAWAGDWLGRLGIRPTVIDSNRKALYHAAAVTSAGLLVGLMDAAFAMAAEAGIDAQAAVRMLVPLARSTLDNLERMSPTDALTGPVARGDSGVLEAHRAALGLLADGNVAEVYEALTRRTQAIRERE